MPADEGDILVTRDHPELLQRLPAIVYISDVGAAGRWHYVSPQIETILGFSAEEWLADPEIWLGRLHPEDREWVLASEASYDGSEGHPTAIEYRILHRTGHSLGEAVHGNGVNMDDYETHDDRRILPGTGFTIEPGVYFDDFGVRTEINMIVTGHDAEVTGPMQAEIQVLV